MKFHHHVKAAEKHLSGAHPLFHRHIKSRGGCKIKLRPGGYQVLCSSIISQQISTLAAKSISRKVMAYCGGKKFDPEVIFQAPEDDLRACGLSRGKVRYLKALSEKVIEDPRFFKRLPRLTDEQIMESLLPIPGIGPWTVEMFMMFSLGRMDVLPVADLGIQKGFQKLFELTELPKKKQMIELAEPWRPYRSVACFFLWAMQDGSD
ncbi:DNA-3-methyladenine glycosylase 2 family protein [Telmatocola sphagniphila]|uniref:DNA-3-methyladenine glycosylase II n=1 Tax=Telmatocola sphagniphila TaxID=1123043 RepID=A0A8E6B880_9BACT|nr:DNA-3-methyladenine glycosylase [Telmatocola sphagniphila]QVL33069.1 DNA-3-methyladenine glycosylase 2 family protein [Telmatocola sphagniphila]